MRKTMALQQAGARAESSSRRPRLADVARLAEVSLGSASRALSIPHAVKPQTLHRVRAAAEKLGYLPDGAARALAMGRSQTVGVVLPTVNNPIYADFVHALQKQLAGGGYYLLISAHEYDRAQERAQVERLLERGTNKYQTIDTALKQPLHLCPLLRTVVFVCRDQQVVTAAGKLLLQSVDEVGVNRIIHGGQHHTHCLATAHGQRPGCAIRQVTKFFRRRAHPMQSLRFYRMRYGQRTRSAAQRHLRQARHVGKAWPPRA